MSKKGSIILTLSTGCMLSGPMSAECKLENANPSETSIFYVVIDFFSQRCQVLKNTNAQLGTLRNNQERFWLVALLTKKLGGICVCVGGVQDTSSD